MPDPLSQAARSHRLYGVGIEESSVSGWSQTMEEQMPKKSKRVAMYEKDAGDEVGRKLIKVLLQVMEDGIVSDSEAKSLKIWLEKAAKLSDLPGIPFLLEEVETLLADGRVTEEESDYLVCKMLRVLPAYTRSLVEGGVNEILQQRKEKRNAEWRKQMYGPTERQLAFLQSLGGSAPPNASRSDVSDVIDKLVNSRPTTRQCMVLRFWDRLDLMKNGVEGVSNWLDRFYLEDPDRQLAWMLFKTETPNSQSRNYEDVEKIPIGAGSHYLQRIKNNRQNPTALTESVVPPSANWGIVAFRIAIWGLVVLLAIVVVAALLYLR